MLGVPIMITQAGLDALVNAQSGSTAAIQIAQIGLSGAPFTMAPTLTGLPGEFKRIGSVAGQAVSPTMIHLVAQDSSEDTYTAHGFGLFLADGTLFAVYSQPTPLVSKVSVASFLIAVDVAFTGAVANSITFGDASFLNPPASETVKGVVELATMAEAQAGIDTLRALTPAAARWAIMGWLLGQDGAGSGLDADLLDGQDGSFYTNIPARLGFSPLPASAYHPADVLAKLLTVDGSGSGLDADLLDGQDGSFYTNIPARLGFSPLPASAYHPADVLAKLLTVDGSGSGLDADMLDGMDSSGFAQMDQFTGANQSLTTNGFQKLPGGLIMQWGEIFALQGEGLVSVTWPIPFPTACFPPVGIIRGASSGADMWLQLESYHQGGATFRYQSTGGNQGYGLAFEVKGY